MHAGGDQPRDVSHVHHQMGATGIGGLAEAREVDLARVRAGARDDELRLVLQGQAHHLVVVDALGLPVHTVGHDTEHEAREVDRTAVGQVTAMRQVHAEDGVTRLEAREVDRHVGLGAAVGLNVDVFGAEQSRGSLDGQ